MAKLIEEYRRKPDFDPGDGRSVPVRLADGQEWHFPRPWLEVIPVVVEGKAVDSTRCLTCGDDLDVLLEAIAAADGRAQILAIVTLGVFLLARNYDLDDGDYRRLLVYRAGDPESEETFRAIVDVATGRLSGIFGRGAFSAPKPPAAG